MITVSNECKSVLAGSGYVYRLSVELWLGGVLLSATVPVSSGGEETDGGLNVPERVTLALPRVVDGVNWTKVLAAKGHRLHVKLGVGLSLGRTEWFSRGRFLIYEVEPDGDTITVIAVGLQELLNQARLISPYQPSGTIVSTLRGLVEPALTVLVDSSLTDRAVPTAINYDEDRLGVVHELLDAWPARAVVDPEGYLRATAPTQSATSQLSIADTGDGSTIIRASGSSTREGDANVIVARGTASDGSQVQGVAYIGLGPTAFGGPYNPLPVPFFFQSPLLTSVFECTQAAATIAARRQRQAADEYHIRMVPNPTIQYGDVVDLTSAELGLTNELCVVESLSLPYKAAGDDLPDMALTVRTLA